MQTRQFSSAIEAARSASTLAASWSLGTGIQAEKDRLMAFCADVDGEYAISPEDSRSRYTVDGKGSIGLTNDDGASTTWIARAIAPVAGPAPDARIADSPRQVVVAALKDKLSGFKDILSIKKLPRRLLVPAVIMLVSWIGTVLLDKVAPVAARSAIARLVSFITFAEGGLSDNYFHQLGGMMGKTLVSATLFALVLGGARLLPAGVRSLTSMLARLRGEDRMSVLPVMLSGAGAAMMLYNFFNGSLSLSLSMVGVAGALSMLWAMGGGVNFLRRMAVSLTAVKGGEGGKIRFVDDDRTAQALAGLAIGFALSVPLSAIPVQYLLYSLGFIAMIAALVMRSRQAGSMAKAAVVCCVLMAGLDLYADRDPSSTFIFERCEDDPATLLTTKDPNKVFFFEDMTPEQKEMILEKLDLDSECLLPFLLHWHKGRAYEVFYDAPVRGETVWTVDEDGSPTATTEELPGPISSIHYVGGKDGSAGVGAGAAGTAVNAGGSVIAILLSLIGFIPGMGGGSYPGQEVPVRLPGERWIRRDEDGDIEYTDPVTGKTSSWVRQKDGRYRKAGEGSFATEDELREMAENAERNSGYYKEIAQKHEQALKEQHEQLEKEIAERNEKYWKQLMEKAVREQREKQQREYIDRLKEKYGEISDEDLRKRLIKERTKAGVEYDENMAWADWMEAGYKSAENIKKGADIGVDVLANYTGPAGEWVKTAYTFGSELASDVTTAWCEGGSITEAAAAALSKASISTFQNMVGDGDSEVAKYVVNTFGEAMKKGIDALKDGKTPQEAFSDFYDGAMEGLIGSSIDSVFGGIAGAAGGETIQNFAGTEIAEEHIKAFTTLFSSLAKNSVNG